MPIPSEAAPILWLDAPEVKQSEYIPLNLPDTIELQMLINMVHEELGVQFIYDQALAKKKILIKSPKKIKRSELMSLFGNVLKTQKMVLIRTTQDGWMRIINANEMSKHLKTITQKAGKDILPTDGLTQIFKFKHISADKIDAAIRSFLTDSGQTFKLSDQNILIITDYASVIDKVKPLIALLDVAVEQPQFAILPCKHLEAKDLAAQIKAIIVAQENALPNRGVRGNQAKLQLAANARMNTIAVIGTEKQIAHVKAIAAKVDIDLGVIPESYALQTASAKDVDGLIKKLYINQLSERLYHSEIDEKHNLLVIRTTPELHAKIKILAADLDKKTSTAASPIQFYKLLNAQAPDVLKSIEAIVKGTEKSSGNSSNFTPLKPETSSNTSGLLADLPSSENNNTLNQAVSSIDASNATISADAQTNTIIVIGDASAQKFYKLIIDRLDKRRPQVLIEFLIVTLDTSNGFSLGVDVSVGDRNSNPQTLAISSSGVSVVDAVTGNLTVTPGLGFNGSVLRSDIADIVIKALKTSGKSKLVSAPRLLVKDNEQGNLSSVLGQPTTSTNSSTTNSSVTFGSFQEAGTTITAKPTIGEGDYLTLDYTVTVSSFSGEGSGGIPAPRQSTNIKSIVTIPDGETIIVGGLNQNSQSHTTSRIPILGSIPGLKHLFGSQNTSQGNSTLFVLIKPIILRDDNFSDLKYLSLEATQQAKIGRRYPLPKPVSMQ